MGGEMAGRRSELSGGWGKWRVSEANSEKQFDQTEKGEKGLFLVVSEAAPEKGLASRTRPGWRWRMPSIKTEGS